MTLVQLPEPASPVEKELRRNQTEVAYWSYCVPCVGVKYYTYEDLAAPIKPPGPPGASLQKDVAG